MTDTLTPDAALAILDRHAGAYRKTGRATREMVIEQGRIVAEVYAACEVAGIKPARWLHDHWDGVSENTVRNWRRFYEHQDAIPEECTPSTAYALFAPSVSDDARDYLLDLLRQGVQLTDALVKKIIRDDVFTESISMVASYLLERKARPKEIVNELEALKAEIDSRRATGLAFDETFTEAVMQRAIAQRESAHGPRVVLFSRFHEIVGGGRFDLPDVPAEMVGADGRVFRLIVEEVREAA